MNFEATLSVDYMTIKVFKDLNFSDIIVHKLYRFGINIFKFKSRQVTKYLIGVPNLEEIDPHEDCFQLAQNIF